MGFGLAINKPRQKALEDSASFANIAERFRKGGELQRAVALCRDGLRRFPEHVSARVTLGLALVDLGEFEQAGEALRQALKRAPDNLAAIRGLAHLHDHHDHGDGKDDMPMESVWQPVNEHQPREAAVYHRPDAPVDSFEELAQELAQELAKEEPASVTVAFAAPAPAPAQAPVASAAPALELELEPARAVTAPPRRIRVRHRDPELQGYFDALPYAPPPPPEFDPFELEDVMLTAKPREDDVLDLSGLAESLDAGA